MVGAAARDVAADDPRGWRMGGGVTYGALTLGRLGLRTTALVGVDEPAASGRELDLLRQSGVDVVLVPLERGPIFDNRETPAGRVQTCVQPSDQITPPSIDPSWRDAAWLFAPVAGEVGDEWVRAAGADRLVGVAWQGLLRDLRAGQRTGRRAPGPMALLRRADLVGVSHQDVEPGTSIADLLGLLGPTTTLVLTDGPGGGLVLEPDAAGRRRELRYPAVPADDALDPTGAGDVFLAALLAARLRPAQLAGPPGRHGDLRLAAAAASLVVERPGLLGVPTLRAVLHRLVRSTPGAARRDTAPA